MHSTIPYVLVPIYIPSALLKLPVTMNRVTHVVPWAHTGPTQLKFGEKIWRERERDSESEKKKKEKSQWSGKVELRTKKKLVAVGEACVTIS